MTYTAIRLDKQGPVWRVVMNRPEVRNAHDLAMFEELSQAFGEVEASPECRVAVLAAEGQVFCAGQ